MGRRETRAETFDRVELLKSKLRNALDHEKFQRLSSETRDELQRAGIVSPWDLWTTYDTFLTMEVLPFVKFFDLACTDEDPTNFYMEREWRVCGSVHFKLTDIERVIIPRQYSSRWRQNFADYTGQITFL